MIDVPMPQLGESVAEGTVTKWVVREGDHVEREQVLLEVATDKADTEVTAPPRRGESRRSSPRKAQTLAKGAVCPASIDEAAGPSTSAAAAHACRSRQRLLKSERSGSAAAKSFPPPASRAPAPASSQAPGASGALASPSTRRMARRGTTSTLTRVVRHGRPGPPHATAT
jgi:2-oxoglutarate dehydrogenase E2 component (dihydrolipoamide succinyltransferase)